MGEEDTQHLELNKAREHIEALERQLMKSKEQVAQLVNELFMIEKEANS